MINEESDITTKSMLFFKYNYEYVAIGILEKQGPVASHIWSYFKYFYGNDSHSSTIIY